MIQVRPWSADTVSCSANEFISENKRSAVIIKYINTMCSDPYGFRLRADWIIQFRFWKGIIRVSNTNWRAPKSVRIQWRLKHNILRSHSTTSTSMRREVKTRRFRHVDNI